MDGNAPLESVIAHSRRFYNTPNFYKT